MAEIELTNIGSGADEPHLVINPDKSITVPESLKRIAVQYDHNVETVTFDCPRWWDGHDLSEMQIFINFQRPGGYREPCPAENVEIDDSDSELLHFTWTLSKNATFESGKLRFLVCAKNINENGVEQNHWNSQLCNDLEVMQGMECSDQISEDYPDVLTAVLGKLEKLEEEGFKVDPADAETAVEKYLAENPVEPTPIDATLTKEGEAAEAKATGNRLATLEKTSWAMTLEGVHTSTTYGGVYLKLPDGTSFATGGENTMGAYKIDLVTKYPVASAAASYLVYISASDIYVTPILLGDSTYAPRLFIMRSGSLKTLHAKLNGADGNIDVYAHIAKLG